jgi:hypothetical protein
VRRFSVLAGLLALALSPSAPAQGATAGPAMLRAGPAHPPQLDVTAPFRAAPLLVSGTDGYRDGEFVYQDYLLDDHGADTTPGLGSSATWSSAPLFAPAGGDVLYPTGARWGGDAADLVELRIRPTARDVVYRATLAGARAPDAAVVGIGVDTDRSGGAAVAWPYGAGVATPGLDRFITAWGTGGAVSDLATGARVALPPGAVRMDVARAQMTITVPRSLMDPGRATWRYVAGTGLWDGHGWMPVPAGVRPAADHPVSGNPVIGAPAVFNLAFRFHEPVGAGPGDTGLVPYTTQPGTGSWFDDGQAHDLAAGGTGDCFEDVDFGALAAGGSRDLHAPGRVQARVLASGLPLPGGVDHARFPEFGDPLQPYLVTLPSGYRPGHPAGVLFTLHPSNSGYQPFDVFMPNWARQLGDARSSLVVTPLSRGLNGPDEASGAFTGAAEADFFETWADLARHFTLDRSRVWVGGYSLGGYAAYALAETWPDLFAGVFSVVGAPPSNGRNTELLGNLRWVPVMAWNQADDTEVPYTGASAAERRLTALGLRHEAWTFPAGGHLGPALRDDWAPAAPWLDATRVVRDPPRIDLGVYPSLDDPALGLVHDHAYWISGVRVAPGGAARRGDVTARSLAFGLGDPPARSYDATGTAGGAVAAIHGVRWGAPVRVRARNALALNLRGVTALRVDGVRARLSARRPLTVTVATDTPAAIRIDLGSGRGVRLSVPPGGGTFRVS